MIEIARKLMDDQYAHARTTVRFADEHFSALRTTQNSEKSPPPFR